jgi:hypothetical protein
MILKYLRECIPLNVKEKYKTCHQMCNKKGFILCLSRDVVSFVLIMMSLEVLSVHQMDYNHE